MKGVVCMEIPEYVKELVQVALEARKMAYVPYSNYQVGAALLTEDNTVYQGCNIENASYGACNCAERTAFFKAVSEGKRSFKAIAIVGGIAEQEPTGYAYPCGICRQVMQEFCKENFVIAVATGVEDIKLFTLSELLPYGFGGDAIK